MTPLGIGQLRGGLGRGRRRRHAGDRCARPHRGERHGRPRRRVRAPQRQHVAGGEAVRGEPRGAPLDLVDEPAERRRLAGRPIDERAVIGRGVRQRDHLRNRERVDPDERYGAV
jgi:hypothetical protein